MTAPESAPLGPPDSTEAAAPEAAASAVAPATPVAPEPPPRAVWTANTPTAPWCPAEWHDALRAAAPGLAFPDAVTVDTAGSGSAGTECEGRTLHARDWRLVLASRRGRLHAHRGEHREDAGAIATLPDGWIAAIGDGAGSAPWSRLGSAIATHVVTDVLHAQLVASAPSREAVAGALRVAASAAHDAMRRFADAVGVPYKALRTTLLVVVVQGSHAGVLQVGDGAMALRRRDGTLIHPHAAATGDFSGEVAHFLPDDGALDVLLASAGVHEATDVEAVLLASDGVEDPWYPFSRHAATLLDVLTRGVGDAAVLPSGLVPSWPGAVVGDADPVQALSTWLAFEKRGENDDRTLCIATRER